MRAAHRRLWIEGAETEGCAISVINSGPHVLTINGPDTNLYALDNVGCWSEATRDLHRLLDGMFGEVQRSVADSDLTGRRVVSD